MMECSEQWSISETLWVGDSQSFLGFLMESVGLHTLASSIGERDCEISANGDLVETKTLGSEGNHSLKF